MKTYIIETKEIEIVKYAVNAESEDEAVHKINNEECFEICKTCCDFFILAVNESKEPE
jgi:hypothetical protein